MPNITIRQGTEDEAEDLWNEVCPHDHWDADETSVHYVAYHEGHPIAFGSMRPLDTDPGWWYLTAAAVLPQYEGHGLQRRLIRARVNYVRARGGKGVLTYTILKNYPSMINLLKCGFRFYHPANPYAGTDVHYYYKETPDE